MEAWAGRVRGGSADGGRERFGDAAAGAEAEWLLPAEWPLREGSAREAFAEEAFAREAFGWAWEALGLLREAFAEEAFPGEAFAREAFGWAWEALGLLGEALAEGFSVPGAEGSAAECSSLGRPVGDFCTGWPWADGPDSARPGGVRPLPGWLPACASSAEAEAEARAGAGAEVMARVGAGSAAYA
jgi:hypothetical protein